MKYKILYASEPEKLSEEVQSFLDAGWSLYGPLTMAYGFDSETGKPRVVFAREITRDSTHLEERLARG